MLTQIRNIRKTILPTQMPLTILKTCVSISPWSTHMSPSGLRSPPHPSTHTSPVVTLKHWRWSQLRLREQPWLLHGDDADCRYLAINRRCLHTAQYCKSSKIIMRTLRCSPSYSKMIKPRSLPLLMQSGWAETCCSSSWWFAPPSWSSTNMFQLILVNSFLCTFLKVNNRMYLIYSQFDVLGVPQSTIPAFINNIRTKVI